jgi:hypothetical protein
MPFVLAESNCGSLIVAEADVIKMLVLLRGINRISGCWCVALGLSNRVVLPGNDRSTQRLKK